MTSFKKTLIGAVAEASLLAVSGGNASAEVWAECFSCDSAFCDEAAPRTEAQRKHLNSATLCPGDRVVTSTIITGPLPNGLCSTASSCQSARLQETNSLAFMARSDAAVEVKGNVRACGQNSFGTSIKSEGYKKSVRNAGVIFRG